MTLRDDVWDAVLHKLVAEGKFKISDLPFEEAQRHTVRRTLREMQDMGWVTRESEQAAIWRIGDTGKLLLSVDEATVERARN